jgi:hypothetical protein
MASKVLYFPYISVPQTAWFTRILLYWDQVGSIVPSAYAADLNRLSPFMRDLVAEGLVRPVVPGDYEFELYDAMTPFFRFIDTDPEILQRAAMGLGSTPAGRGKQEPGTVFEIHGEKLGREIGDQLVARGLARRGEEPAWFEVESRTASAFMAHLTATLGALEDIEMDPITDDMSHLAPFWGGRDEHPSLSLAGDLRLSVLERVLPGPTESVPVAELVKFRNKHGERLSSFRRTIESEILDLALVDDGDIRAAKLRLFHEQLEDDIKGLEASMRARRWPRLVFGALCGVVSAAIPVAASAVTGALPIAAAGIPSLAAAIYSAREAAGSRKDFLRHPLAYAALARGQLS